MSYGPPALAGTVPNIVDVRAEEQVCWIAAHGIVAMVTHEQMSRNPTKMQRPRNPVGTKGLADRVESSISLIAESKLPLPAIMGSANFYSVPELFAAR